MKEGNDLPADKKFQTVDEQIKLLETRDLQIDDSFIARLHLLEKNYFNLINGFETLLLEDPKNPPKKYVKKNFNDFLGLHEFDMEFSSIIFRKISEFETKLKASIAYHFCKNHCSNLSDNNNYIDVNSYKIPLLTDGPKEYVSYFYNAADPRKTHKLFRTNYCFNGRLRGNFDGVVTYLRSNQTKIEGVFKGRFGSTSIREVSGSCIFYNSNEPKLFADLQAITTNSGVRITVPINMTKDERILGLSYIDECKIKYRYINEYNNPPFWVIIKTLMLNDLIVLLYGLKKCTFDDVLKDFNLKPNDKEKFLNSLEIIRELRNTCAHFELVNRFRTPPKLKLNARLISELNLSPGRSQYIIKLYDVLKVFGQYVDLFDLKSFLLNYYHQQKKANKEDIAISLLNRMGNANINDWI